MVGITSSCQSPALESEQEPRWSYLAESNGFFREGVTNDSDMWPNDTIIADVQHLQVHEVKRIEADLLSHLCTLQSD